MIIKNQLGPKLGKKLILNMIDNQKKQIALKSRLKSLKEKKSKINRIT